jgi:hypothetical protein
MNINKALKQKNKLVVKANDAYRRFSTYNSFEENSHIPYDARESYNQWINLTNELVELKTKIHKANLAIYDKIFRLSELKNLVSKLKNVSCNEGTSTNNYTGIQTKTKAVMSINERDELIAKFEDEIETLQDELEVHNATTKI